jgi:ABC-type branched-subunit amino acid transport system substrate-binding protein
MKWISLRSSRRRQVLVSMTAAAAFLLTACSSASTSTTSADPASTSSSSSASAPAASTSASSASSAGPIKIGLGSTVIPGVYDAQTQYLAGITAAEGYINTHGGWGGRTVQLVQCQSPGDPASDLKCYHSVIGSQPVAMMGLLENSETYLPLLVQAHIPSFMFAGSASEEQSPWSMGLGGVLESYTAAAKYACAKGYKNVTVFQQDVPSSRDSEAAFAAGIFSACKIQVNNVYMPLGTADPAPYIQKAVATNPQLLFMSGQSAPITTFLSDFTAAHFPIDKVLTVPTSAPGWLSNSASDGLLIMGGQAGYPAPQSTDADNKTFLQYMAKYSPSADPTAALTLPAFQDMLTIWEVGKAIGFNNLTGQALYNYMNNVAPGHLNIFDTHGDVVIPPVWVGVKDPYEHIMQWTGSAFVDDGWWGGDWSCTSASTCAAVTPPAGSKA